jgi:hypothetical protein
MRSMIWIGSLWISVQMWAGPLETVEQATARFELALAKTPASLRPGFRSLAAKALRPRHPL